MIADRWHCRIPSCTCVLKVLASISSFASFLRGSLYDGFLQISTKISYPISSRREQCLSRCTIFRWCQRYEAERVNIKDLSLPGHAHVLTNSVTISTVDEIIWQNHRITTREIAV
ncbi:hypothetical protein AVEN_113056-1 [Araneus ventricosus]|uniref:Mos1 transposase HTH domain-containing protein n=1 Tax=Araneus ventricosus TaxID=182803 RepID=A0A4Y2VJP3_ARAVE|nr:hypothetical protein AVEN_113056-1 [Araneus ventricosus]